MLQFISEVKHLLADHIASIKKASSHLSCELAFPRSYANISTAVPTIKQ